MPLAGMSIDTELRRCVASASSLVGGLLNAQDLMVPAVVPQILVDSSKYFAAWDFMRKKNPAKAEAFWQKADKLLSDYVGQFCRGGVSFDLFKNRGGM